MGAGGFWHRPQWPVRPDGAPRGSRGYPRPVPDEGPPPAGPAGAPLRGLPPMPRVATTALGRPHRPSSRESLADPLQGALPAHQGASTTPRSPLLSLPKMGLRGAHALLAQNPNLSSTDMGGACSQAKPALEDPRSLANRGPPNGFFSRSIHPLRRKQS